MGLFCAIAKDFAVVQFADRAGVPHLNVMVQTCASGMRSLEQLGSKRLSVPAISGSFCTFHGHMQAGCMASIPLPLHLLLALFLGNAGVHWHLG